MSPAPLFTRYSKNPVLTASDWPNHIDSVFNPAATMDGDDTVLVCRIEDQRGLSHLGVARSPNGRRNWQIEPYPLLEAEPTDPSSLLGVEDPRVTRVDELDGWVIAYTACSREGYSVALALTTDFAKATRLGVAMPPDDKNAALLPRRVNDSFVLFHRPKTPHERTAGIWLSTSPDLHAWAQPTLVLQARTWPWWDSARVGMGPPPIETPAGWLAIYHGVKNQVNGAIYRAGLMLLDRANPAIVLRRSDERILSPAAPYEITGNTPNVVFPTGLIHDPATGQLRLYYGAADTCIGLATAQLSDVLDYLLSLPAVQPRPAD